MTNSKRKTTGILPIILSYNQFLYRLYFVFCLLYRHVYTSLLVQVLGHPFVPWYINELFYPRPLLGWELSSQFPCKVSLGIKANNGRHRESFQDFRWDWEKYLELQQELQLTRKPSWFLLLCKAEPWKFGLEWSSSNVWWSGIISLDWFTLT